MNKKKIFISFFLLLITLFLIMSTQTLAVTVSKVNNLTVNVQDTSAYLNWDKVENATGYDVYVNIPNRGYIYLGSVTKNAATVRGFTKGETYAIKVKAYENVNGLKITGNESNEVRFTAGQNSEELYVSTLEKVKNLKSTVNSTSRVTFDWTQVQNASGYEVYVNISNRGYACLGAVTRNSAVVSGFQTGINYAVKIRAYNYVNGQKTFGDYSDEIIVKTGDVNTPSLTEDLDRVYGLDVDVENNKAYLSWNKVSDASGYEIYVEKPDNSNKTITTTGTSYTLTGVTDSSNYTAKVRAYKYVDGKRVYGEYSSVVRFRAEEIDVDKVYGLDVDVENNKAYVSWDRVSGASGYEMYVTYPDGDRKTITTTSTKYTLTGITDSSENCTVKVRAYKYVNSRRVYGDYSSTIRFKSEKTTVARVTGLGATITDDKVKLSWSKVSGASGYEINFYIPGKGYSTITTTSTSRTITGLTDTSNYYKAKVRAYKTVSGKKVYGEYSVTKQFKSKKATVARVTGLGATVTGDRVKLSWNRVTGADGYEICFYVPGVGNTTITTTSTNRTISGLTDKNYYYKAKVRAYEYVNGKKVYGDYSVEKQFKGR